MLQIHQKSVAPPAPLANEDYTRDLSPHPKLTLFLHVWGSEYMST